MIDSIQDEESISVQPTSIVMPRVKSRIYVKGQQIERVIHGLVYLLLLTIIVPEARLGLHGIQYPDLSFGSSYSPAGLPFLCEVVILAIVGVFCFGIFTRRLSIPSSWYFKWIVGTAYWNSIGILLSYLLNIVQTSGGFGAFRMISEGLALFVVVSNITWSPKSLRKIEVLFVLVGAFHGLVIALSNYKPEILPFHTNDIPTRYAGLFLQPSRASFLLGIAFIIAFTRLVSDRARWTSVIFYVISLFLTFMGMALSQTRTVIIAIPLAVVFVLSQIPKLRVRTQILFRLLIVVGGVGLLLAYAIQADLGVSRLSGINSNTLQAQRGYIWEKAIQIILTHPMGTGLAGFLPLTGSLEIPHAHNMYLHWGVMFGWPGFVLFLLFIVRLYKDSGQRLALFSTSKSLASSFMDLRSAWVICLMVFMTEPYLITNTGYWFWLLTGLLIAPQASAELNIPIK